MRSCRTIMRGVITQVVCAAIMLSTLGILRAHAAVVRYVNTTGSDASNDCTSSMAPCQTLQWAIDQAAAADTIQVAIGTYYANLAPVANLTKSVNLAGGFSADFSSQTGLSTLDGMRTYTTVVVNAGVSATMDHFIIQNGGGGSFPNFGGGIRNQGTLTLSYSVVQNSFSLAGGGIATSGTLVVDSSTIRGNSSGQSGSGGYGGAGIYVSAGTALVTGSTLSGNQIVDGVWSGSAVYVKPSASATLNNTTVSGNGTTWTIAPYALYASSATLVLNNATVVGNAGGVASSSATVTIRNSIVADNLFGETEGDLSGPISSGGYNLVGVLPPSGFTKTDGDLSGTVAVPLDPKLGPLQDNGGPTFTHALQLDSLALDGGNPNRPDGIGPACLATDQRGFSRPPDMEAGRCDMGAFELLRPSVLSINRADAELNSAPTVRFTVTFTDVVSGVDAKDFVLTTTDVTGASISTVTGSASVRTVTVATGAGTGTIRLDLIDNDTILDGLARPLGGVGPVNGDFRGGQVYQVTKPSVVSITRADPDHTTAATLHFTVTFSTSVTGVGTADFVLTTNGVTGASIAGVTGSGTTYTVAVHPGDGPGTVRLDVVDDDTIADAWGTKLGGTGAGNGNFAGGETYDILQPPFVYVATTGDDTNTCRSAADPCLTVNAAIGKTIDGDTVKVAIGTYYSTGTDVAIISKDINLSGGWNAGFTAQAGRSTLHGLDIKRGIAVQDGKVTTVDHFIIEHGAEDFGGGISDRGNLTLNDSIVRNNFATIEGGGIDVYGSLTVNNSTISNNIAGTPGSSGGGGGAGIRTFNGSSTATINNSTLSGNQIQGSFWGSAIANDGPVYLNNSTVSGNTGAYALSATGGELVLNNTTVTANTGGMDTHGGLISLRNSMVAANNGMDCLFSSISGGYNLIGIQGPDCAFIASTGDKVGTPGSPINPKLGPLANNGGPTMTHALLTGSPAINAGNPAAPGSGGAACMPADQRGISRLGTRCDIGAYESSIPRLLAISRVGTTPSSAATIQFAVNFSEPVTGVNIGLSGDFALAGTAIGGASITALSGSGSAYKITVRTGPGNGTLRLNVVDNDSIHNNAGTPLGGTGTGNGSFTSGQAYTMSKTPVAKAPGGTIITKTPTFRWTVVPRATKYQYELRKGTVLIYSGSVDAAACTTVCTKTPTRVLSPGAYQWRVRALIDGAWRLFSPYKSFTVAA